MNTGVWTQIKGEPLADIAQRAQRHIHSVIRRDKGLTLITYGQLGEAIGNLLQQGLGGLSAAPGGSAGSGETSARPSQGRSIPARPQVPPEQAAPPPAPAQNDPPPQADSQPMNEVLRQLFNR